MYDLIHELKNEHTKIIDMLADIKLLGISSIEGFELLFSAKKLIMNHLIRDDRKMFAVLVDFGKQNDKLLQLSTRSAFDMNELFTITQNFFIKYSDEENRYIGQFTKDVAKLIVRLKTRFIMEERYLYSEYKKCIHSHEQIELIH